ncbi:membrane protein insertase YidC [Micromonospora peucetia]|uniref:Membrane protein insertase YidC n=1 Tax=Micromonospora peucetia TaxID=47871 RepID=A0A1C6VEY3_9ACTN|nr:membrane protein insertase YidC [Micromonospora peucetia]MCX4389738.1 membrane protein insertase YidC [Micromonospora peucetia]WSA30207.1 membrane protein insertase YidC [Micromonospora peucetia]SCL64911.1 YidC/Oxa1 family membrane protein insertase [Micromonospora peucetia]
MLAFAPLHDAVGTAGSALTWFTTLLEPLAGDAATAAAIVVLTVVVRLLISPLTLAQVRGERRRAALAPEVRELQRRYADDPARLQGELFALYRANGASPVSGCLPLLLQAPVLLVMYRLFATGEGGTGLLDERLVGVPLGHHLGDGPVGGALPLFGALLAALLALAWWTSRRMRRAAAATGTVAGTPTQGPGAAVLGRLLPLLPYTTVLVALVLPLAAVIYLVTTTGWSALEQAVLRRPRPAPAGIDMR